MGLFNQHYISDCNWRLQFNIAIKDYFHAGKLCDLLKANAQDVNKIIKSLNTAGPVCISAKFFKMSANIIDSHLSNIISEHIFKSRCSANSKNWNKEAGF